MRCVEPWTEHDNDEPKPFIWHRTAKEIIDKIWRDRAALIAVTKTAMDHERAGSGPHPPLALLFGSMGIYREAALWGDEHTELGEIAVAELHPRAAVALSRGKFPKGYPYLDPNEDAVLATTDGANWLLAVVDGHNGFDAARAALNALQRTAEATLTKSATDPETALRTALTLAGAAVTDALTEVEGDRCASATALTVVIVAAGRLTAVTMGDTAAVLVRNGRARRIGSRTRFLDPDVDPAAADLEQAKLQPGDHVVVASDGLLDFLGRSPTRVLAHLTAQHPDNPVDLAGAAIERAFAGGAGDNIAVALLCEPGRMRKP